MRLSRRDRVDRVILIALALCIVAVVVSPTVAGTLYRLVFAGVLFHLDIVNEDTAASIADWTAF